MKLLAVAVASTFALASLGASAAEMTNDEKNELRQRAERLQAQGVQNPVVPSAQRADTRSVAKAPKTTKVKKAKKSKRAGAKRQMHKAKTDVKRDAATK